MNAAGPWVDAIRTLENAGAPPRLSLTKGIHLVVPKSRLPVARTVLMNAADRRPLFAVPRGAVTYIGTTDTYYPEQTYWPEILQADIDYLLEAVARSFQIDPLRPSDVVSSWTGIRPLVSQAGKKPAEISRRDEVWLGPGGILSIAGGKLTAYRRMAERVVDRVVAGLNKKVLPDPSSDEPLCGGDADPTSIRTGLEVQMGRAEADRLSELYGSEAPDVAGDGGDVAAEVRQAVLREGALCLEDYWIRRSARAWFDTDAGLSSLEPASSEMAKLLGWDEAKRVGEIAGCREQHEERNALFR